MELSLSAANKGLTEILTPLDATLAKNTGAGGLLLLTRNLKTLSSNCRPAPILSGLQVTFPQVAALLPECYDLVFHDTR